MTWTGWDIVIVALFVLQLASLVAIVMAVLRIKNGPVAWGMGRTRSLTERGKTLVATGQSVFSADRTRLTALFAHLGGLRATLRGSAVSDAFAGEPLSYAKMFAALATVRKVQSGLAIFGALRKQGLKAAVAEARPNKKSGPPRRSVLDRLGLIPPAARHIGPTLRIVRTAVGVHKQLRKRGLL